LPVPSSRKDETVRIDDAARTFNPGATALLIQDVVPWHAGTGQDGRGADVTELKVRRDGRIDIANAGLVGVVDLSQYREVVIAAAQPQSFYDSLFPNGQIHYALVDWVKNGGVLSAHLADYYGGNWDGCFFLQGVTKAVNFSNENAIFTPEHPIVTGLYGGANGGQIVDVASREDLADWNYSSHGWFRHLPAEKTILFTEKEGGLAQEHKPVMVEFPFGRGRVIASMMTLEWRYVGDGGVDQNKKLLANEIGYQLHLGGVVAHRR
jgi:hypothetical protein